MVFESACKYEINNGRLDSAIRFLNIYAEPPIHSSSYRKHTSIVYPEDDSPFFGKVKGWKGYAEHFMREYCLANSYATFRDEDGVWYMAHVDDQGEVCWDTWGTENPFKRECERLEI